MVTSRNLFFVVLCAALSFVSIRGVAEDFPENESFIQFTSKGKIVPSQIIGYLGERDNFGGNKVFTPKHKISIYVNFNIRGTIDLDQIDDAFDRVTPPQYKDWYKKREIAVISVKTMEHFQGKPAGAFLNFAKTTLFVSDQTLTTPDGFKKVIEAFYSSL